MLTCVLIRNMRSEASFNLISRPRPPFLGINLNMTKFQICWDMMWWCSSVFLTNYLWHKSFYFKILFFLDVLKRCFLISYLVSIETFGFSRVNIWLTWVLNNPGYVSQPVWLFPEIYFSKQVILPNSVCWFFQTWLCFEGMCVEKCPSVDVWLTRLFV